MNETQARSSMEMIMSTFHSAHLAIDAKAAVSMVVVLDDDNRENKRELTIAAVRADAKSVAFIIRGRIQQGDAEC